MTCFSTTSWAGPVGRLKDIGNVVLDLVVFLVEAHLADSLGPTVDYLTRDAPAEARQLDQLATALEPRQYENPCHTQGDCSNDGIDAGIEPVDLRMLQPGHGRIGADIAQGHGRARRQTPVVLGADFDLAEEGTLRLARAGWRFIRQGEEVGDMQIIAILMPPSDDDGGGDHPFLAQPVLFHEGPKGAPQGQQGPRAEQAPEDKTDNSIFPGSGIPTGGGGSIGVAHGMDRPSGARLWWQPSRTDSVHLSLSSPCTVTPRWRVRLASI